MKLTTLIQKKLANTAVWQNKPTDIEIHWVSLSAEHCTSTDLLLLDSLESLLPETAFAAVLINQAPQPLPPGISPTCPILWVKEKQSLRKLAQDLYHTLMDREEALLERRLAIHEQLAKNAADNGDLRTLAQVMRHVTGHAVLIQDKRLTPIAAVPDPTFADIWPELVASLSEAESLPQPLHNRKAAGEMSTPVHQPLSGGLERLVIPVTVNQVARGYLSIIYLSGTLDELDHITAAEGARFCAIEMAHNKAIRETEKKLQSNLLNALLHGILPARDAELWFQAMGLTQNEAHIPLQFAWDSPNPPSRRRLETIVNGIIKEQNLTVILNPTGDKVICFYQMPKNTPEADAPLSFARDVITQAFAEYPETPVRCGVGTAAQDTNSWNRSFKESSFALELAFRLQESQPLYYPALSIYRLLMLLENHPELDSFQEDILGPLLAQDNRSVLVETLEAYYRSGGNLSQTAESLYIHRNTLSYRLERISEISGLDFTNPDANLAMQIALRLYRLKKGN